jgi:hypothetical protein
MEGLYQAAATNLFEQFRATNSENQEDCTQHCTLNKNSLDKRPY